MKIKNKNYKRRLLLLTLVIILLIASGIGLYYYLNRNHSTGHNDSRSGTNLKPPTKEEKAAGDQAKSSTANQGDTNTNSSKNPGSTTSPSNSSNVNVQTTASAQNGTTYQLRYLIGSIDNSATCTLTLSNGSTTVTKTAKTQALAQSSTCQGFDIPTSELSTGSWQATMVVSGGNINGSTTSTIKVQ